MGVRTLSDLQGALVISYDEDAGDNYVLVGDTPGWLKNEKIAMPIPGDGQILVRVEACGLNVDDHSIRDDFDDRPWPRIPGQEIVGIVSDYPAQFKWHNFQPGDRVFGQPAPSNGEEGGYEPGGLQQFCILDADICGLVPKTLSDAQATTSPRDCFRAFSLLFSKKMGEKNIMYPPPSVFMDPNLLGQKRITQQQARHREAIVVIGASSHIGKFVLQFARMLEFGRIIAIGAKGDEFMLKSYGASHVIDEAVIHTVVQVRVGRICGERVARVIDCVNTKLELAVSLLPRERRGMGITVSNFPMGLAPWTSAFARKAYQVHTPEMCHPSESDLGEEFWERLPGWIMSGCIRPLSWTNVPGGLNASAVNAVLDAFREGKENGKHVVFPNKSGLYLGNERADRGYKLADPTSLT